MSASFGLEQTAFFGRLRVSNRSQLSSLRNAKTIFRCKVQALVGPRAAATEELPAEDYRTWTPEEFAKRTEDFTKQIIEDEHKYIVQTYARPNVVFVRGNGVRQEDACGKKYLDFAAGIAVNALGHNDEDWLVALMGQAQLLAHTSNLFHTIPQVVLARRLVEESFADRVFFANSGTEANEAAIKFCRKFARVQAGVDPYDPNAEAPYEIVSFTNSFHGRTMGALALTYKEQYKTPFQPVMPGAVMVPYQDLEAAAQVIKKGKTAGVIVEPVQGEGGIFPATQEFLAGLRRLCDEAGALLIFDEIQVGLGRTGHLWAHQPYHVFPDIMTLAKPLAGGLPIGAVLVTERVAQVMKPGDHGSTFAGNPLVCNAAVAVFQKIANPEFLDAVARRGERLVEGLRKGLAGNPHVKEVRGRGLICGIQLDQPAGPLCDAAREDGLLVITAGKGDIIRLVPPLIVKDADVDEAIAILVKVINDHAKDVSSNGAST